MNTRPPETLPRVTVHRNSTIFEPIPAFNHIDLAPIKSSLWYIKRFKSCRVDTHTHAQKQTLVQTTPLSLRYRWASSNITKQEVKVIWQKAPHGGPIPRLGVTPGGRKLYHWIPGVGVPISVP